MSEHTKKDTRIKPAKPYPDFPLFPHATGRWAKKIRGRTVYFGPWDDPDAALEKYLDERDDLYAGRVPRRHADGLAVRDVVNQYLTHKQDMLDTGEIVERTFRDYFSTCERIVNDFGRNRLVTDLTERDFRHLRNTLAKSRGHVSLGNEIQRVRMVFKFAFDEGLIDRPIRYGQSFKKPSKVNLRKHRRKQQAENGKRMFDAAVLAKVLRAAKQPLRTMTLLGINCGLGQTDIAALPRSAVDLDRGWIDYPRPKTGADRRCPLWRETARALRHAIANRPRAKNDEDEGLVFLTKYGHRWVRTNPNGNGTPNDEIGKQFSKLLQKLKVKRRGLNFYALRHTVETVGGECKDQVALDLIMGHARDDMASCYREDVSDSRLIAVSTFIHDWLWPRTPARGRHK